MFTTIMIIFALIFYVAGVGYFATKYNLEKSRAEQLDKQLTGQLNDFEKIQLISKIYSDIDFEKIRPEQLSDWKNFVKTKLNEPESD